MVVLESGEVSRATADAQVVIRQANKRARRRRITAVAAVAALLIAAFAALVAEGIVPSRPPSTDRTGTVASGAYRGTIEGVIEGCYGSGRGPFQTLDGIVTLLAAPPAATSAHGVFPWRMGGTVVAIERIGRGKRFTFRAPAGRYVVSALAGDRESGFFRYPPVTVSLSPGSTARIITAPTACA